MAMFKLPLSGNVTQAISPMTWWLSPSGGQYGLFNIEIGESGKPEIESEILKDVAGYGKQLGILLDAMVVLARRVDVAQLEFDERKALLALAELSKSVGRIKQHYDRSALVLADKPLF
jgi:hypothetical protein